MARVVCLPSTSDLPMPADQVDKAVVQQWHESGSKRVLKPKHCARSDDDHL